MYKRQPQRAPGAGWELGGSCPDAAYPDCYPVSNGVYHLMLTSSGLSSAFAGGVSVYRGPESPLEGPAGMRIYLETPSGEVDLLPLPGGKGLSLSFPNAPYVALWQPANTAAPFLCIEPWCTLPGLDEKDTVWEQEPGMLRLLPGEHFLHKLDISLMQVGS